MSVPKGGPDTIREAIHASDVFQLAHSPALPVIRQQEQAAKQQRQRELALQNRSTQNTLRRQDAVQIEIQRDLNDPWHAFSSHQSQVQDKAEQIAAKEGRVLGPMKSGVYTEEANKEINRRAATTLASRIPINSTFTPTTQ